MKVGIGVLVALVVVAAAADSPFVKPSPTDSCPVCGMFVAKFPDSTAEVVFADGGYAAFDGARDLFRFLSAVGTYLPRRAKDDIAAVWVTDYYSLRPVDGRTALYVLGSDVNGPMGAELIPFAREEAAREFLVDHKGQRVLRFEEVLGAPEVLR